MSRKQGGGGRKKSDKGGHLNAAPEAGWRYAWTLLIWPLAILALLFFHQQKRVTTADHELQSLEQAAQEELAELELQVSLLEKQLELKHNIDEAR